MANRTPSVALSASPVDQGDDPAQKPLLEVGNLKVHFPLQRQSLFGGRRGVLRAVDGVSFSLHAGETLGLVGESGCGKSTLARAIVNLIRVTSGTVSLWGTEIQRLSQTAMRPYRRQMQMVFQDPFGSLNPRMTIGRIVAEPMHIFGLHKPAQRKLETMRLLDLVGLNPKFFNRYPHEFSGGQRQRIGIARALAVEPRLIVCDEPVSALDVSIQAQVINLLVDLKQQMGLSYLFIAHDLAVVRHVADRVGVMYLGRLVELADARSLYENPRHPYTQALLAAVARADPKIERSRSFQPLRGEVPTPAVEYPGCPFFQRCPVAEMTCERTVPQLEGGQHMVACLLANKKET